MLGLLLSPTQRGLGELPVPCPTPGWPLVGGGGGRPGHSSVLPTHELLMEVASWVQFYFWKPGGQESRVLSSTPASVPTKSHQPNIIVLSMGCGLRRSWVQIPTLPLPGHMVSGQVPNLSEIHFSYLEGGDNNGPASQLIQQSTGNHTR